MGRPKCIQAPTKLNLYVARDVKRRLFRLASLHRRSVSRMVTELTLAAALPEEPVRAPEPLTA